MGFPDVGARLVFDLTFYLIWALIGLNIIVGFVVDSFGELRGKQVCTVW